MTIEQIKAALKRVPGVRVLGPGVLPFILRVRRDDLVFEVESDQITWDARGLGPTICSEDVLSAAETMRLVRCELERK